ncbi:MAG: hypothetical protein AAB368_02710, partial [bacterium]
MDPGCNMPADCEDGPSNRDGSEIGPSHVHSCARRPRIRLGVVCLDSLDSLRQRRLPAEVIANVADYDIDLAIHGSGACD